MESGSTTNLSRLKPSRSNDEIGWKYNKLQDPKNSSRVIYNFCNKVTTGGITKAKRHQRGIKGDVAPCPKCPPIIREELWANLQQKTTTKKLEKDMFMSSCGTVDLEEEDEEEKLMPRESTLSIGGRSQKAKIGQHKGPMDLYMYQKPKETLEKRKLEKCRQSFIKDSIKELRAETIQYIARFFYQNGISFNVARSESFKLMLVDSESKPTMPYIYEATTKAKDAIKRLQNDDETNWWTLFGHLVPNLQKLAIKMLSLTWSASGCERNWSVFEQIHSKKRNRLDHQKMHHLVFVKYNQALKARYDMISEEAHTLLDLEKLEEEEEEFEPVGTSQKNKDDDDLVVE
ncbi:hypothetical protein SLEP1_g26983 [Rubroshorea leprosula]|uniref:HAT C-terminal dimerisation domain-containing protein n=1 Tax=Rubroshorea leprosula TaxID=152421 RepID=A0AAV5JVZ9_9ROSI|nr:hypothetical protein SLEP1_g26983 [Rubroshorea leprosula]